MVSLGVDFRSNSVYVVDDLGYYCKFFKFNFFYELRDYISDFFDVDLSKCYSSGDIKEILKEKVDFQFSTLR